MERRSEHLEQDLEKFNKWLKNLTENGKVEQIEPEVVRGVLESCGANFSELTEGDRESLGRYSNKNKRAGLNAVWGKDKVDMFKRWTVEEYIPYIEMVAGRELHTLYDRATDTYDKTKNSGMVQFLGEITAYAAGELSFEKYQKRTENRIKKGKEW